MRISSPWLSGKARYHFYFRNNETGNVGVRKESCGSKTVFLCKHFRWVILHNLSTEIYANKVKLNIDYFDLFSRKLPWCWSKRKGYKTQSQTIASSLCERSYTFHGDVCKVFNAVNDVFKLEINNSNFFLITRLGLRSLERS